MSRAIFAASALPADPGPEQCTGNLAAVVAADRLAEAGQLGKIVVLTVVAAATPRAIEAVLRLANEAIINGYSVP